MEQSVCILDLLFITRQFRTLQLFLYSQFDRKKTVGVMPLSGALPTTYPDPDPDSIINLKYIV